jgi:hypothetical protein
MSVLQGQIWADNDKRSQGRRIRVDFVCPWGCEKDKNPHAHVVGWDRHGRQTSRTRIRLARFRDNSTGYRLVRTASGRDLEATP